MNFKTIITFFLYLLSNIAPNYNNYVLWLRRFKCFEKVKILSSNELLFLDTTLQIINRYISHS